MCSYEDFLKLTLVGLAVLSAIFCAVYVGKFQDRIRTKHRVTWRWLRTVKRAPEEFEADPRELAIPSYLLSRKYQRLNDDELNRLAVMTQVSFLLFVLFIFLFAVAAGIFPSTATSCVRPGT